MNRATVIAASLMFAATTANAETPTMLPEMLGVEGLRFGTERGLIDWRIDASGSVMLVTVVCPQCRNPNRQRRAFLADPAVYSRVAALLPAGAIERALAAPCTLPHANAGWLQRVELIERRGNAESRRETFRDCRSPELDDLFARLDQASAIVLAAEPKPGKASAEPSPPPG